MTNFMECEKHMEDLKKITLAEAAKMPREDLIILLSRLGGINEETPAPENKAMGTMSTKIDLESAISDILREIGVPAHIKGFQYLRTAIIYAIEKQDMMQAVTKKLYPTIAKEYRTTSSRVERAIRHAIEVAWDRGDVDILSGYFGYTIQNTRGKPTNSEFIAMIADRLRLRLKREGKI